MIKPGDIVRVRGWPKDQRFRVVSLEWPPGGAWGYNVLLGDVAPDPDAKITIQFYCTAKACIKLDGPRLEPLSEVFR